MFKNDDESSIKRFVLSDEKQLPVPDASPGVWLRARPSRYPFTHKVITTHAALIVLDPFPAACALIVPTCGWIIYCVSLLAYAVD
jgi:hypothetical protein